jgi:hypothetical protein
VTTFTLVTDTNGDHMTLVEFLLQRIAEDERYATEANQHKGGGVQGWFYFDGDLGDGYLWTSYQPEFKDPPDTGMPARVLAECEAKRRIIDLWDFANREASMGAEWPVKQLFDGRLSIIEAALRALALPYADHEAYDDEWRP